MKTLMRTKAGRFTVVPLLFPVALLALVLSGCSFGSPDGVKGAKVSDLSDDRLRVNVRARHDAKLKDLEIRALQEGAMVMRERGYAAFEVFDSSTEITNYRPPGSVVAIPDERDLFLFISPVAEGRVPVLGAKSFRVDEILATYGPPPD